MIKKLDNTKVSKYDLWIPVVAIFWKWSVILTRSHIIFSQIILSQAHSVSNSNYDSYLFFLIRQGKRLLNISIGACCIDNSSYLQKLIRTKSKQDQSFRELLRQWNSNSEWEKSTGEYRNAQQFSGKNLKETHCIVVIFDMPSIRRMPNMISHREWRTYLPLLFHTC